MREIRTEIEIHAPIAEVWSVLIDFDNWKDWNPIVNEANGPAALGSKIAITMCGKDGKDAQRYEPIVTQIKEPTYFRWRAKMMAEFLFTNDKIFELEATGSTTKLTHIEAFSGLMVTLFWSKLEGSVPAMLDSMNEALKKTVEKRPNKS